MVPVTRNGPSSHRSALKRYLLASAVTGIAVLLRWCVNPVLGTGVPYITIFPAIILCAWYFGTGPSVLSSLVGLVASHYLFSPARYPPQISATGEVVQVFFFLLVAVFMVSIAEKHRRTVHNLDVINATLEARVEERTAQLQRQTAELAGRSQLLDMANDAVFATKGGKITYWNRGAERLYGWTPEEAMGRDPGELLRSRSPIPRAQIVAEVSREGTWAGDITQVRRDGTELVVSSNWSVWRGQDGKEVGWLEINTDITQRKRAEESLRELTGRLLRLQDEERRRIARELHDSTGQMLVALGINLSGIETELSKFPSTAGQLLADSQQLVQELTKEVRTLSYLLHPPLLDEAGLSSALRWYVEGFSKRSHVLVNLEVDSDVGRLPRETETTIFRIVQECLTNVHRHSGSAFAEIRLERRGGSVRVEVQDEGKGIPPDTICNPKSGSGLGIGITGMRERVRQLGGSLEIISDEDGTLIRAELPIPASSAASSANGPGSMPPAV